jgi:hypothetical protein
MNVAPLPGTAMDAHDTRPSGELSSVDLPDRAGTDSEITANVIQLGSQMLEAASEVLRLKAEMVLARAQEGITGYPIDGRSFVILLTKTDDD